MLPSERVIPPDEPFPPTVILFVVVFPLDLLVTLLRVSVSAVRKFNAGGVYVNSPLALSYVTSPLPAAVGFGLTTDISSNCIPPLLLP